MTSLLRQVSCRAARAASNCICVKMEGARAIAEPKLTGQLLTQIVLSPECPPDILIFSAFVREANWHPSRLPRRFKIYIRYVWRRIFLGIPADPEQERLLKNFRLRPRTPRIKF